MWQIEFTIVYIRANGVEEFEVKTWTSSPSNDEVWDIAESRAKETGSTIKSIHKRVCVNAGEIFRQSEEDQQAILQSRWLSEKALVVSE
jgi:hypothetical protein